MVLTMLVNISSVEIGSNVFIPVMEQQNLTEAVSLIIQWICYTLLCQAIDVFGVSANIINAIIFSKQGFKDTVNISLLGLAVSDIGCVSTLLWSNICSSPAFRSLDLSFDSIEVAYLTTSVPHTVFTRTTCWITALITLERCLCISAPLKVKTIITSRRVTIIIISLFTIFTSTTVPVFLANKLDMKFVPERNKTLFGLVYLDNRDAIEGVSFLVNNIFLPFISFIIIVICTATLVYKLRKISQWRLKSTAVSRVDNISNQNQRVAKMVVMISTMFIVCFTPECCIFLGFLMEPELFIGGKYKNMLLIFGSLITLVESINSSMNIFIYYSMSTKYRTSFMELFCLKRA